MAAAFIILDCLHLLSRSVCFDEYKNHDSLQARLVEGIGFWCFSGILHKWNQMTTAASGLLRLAFDETDQFQQHESKPLEI